MCFLLLPTTGLDLILDTHIFFSLIHRLMVSTIRTGTVTSVVAVLILITFITDVIDKESDGELVWIFFKLFREE